MAYKPPFETKGKTFEEVFKQLAGKQVTGKYLHEDWEYRVAKSLDRHGRVVIEAKDDWGDDHLSYVEPKEIKSWMRAAEINEVIDG